MASRRWSKKTKAEKKAYSVKMIKAKADKKLSTMVDKLLEQ